MKIIHVLRKPLSEGTVTSNVLKHGCGGININASRISTEDNLNGGAYAETPTNQRSGRSNLPGDSRKGAAAGMFQPGSTSSTGFVPPTGRWPANVIFQHPHGCHHNDGDGNETVAHWICAEGCPVGAFGDEARFFKQVGGNEGS